MAQGDIRVRLTPEGLSEVIAALRTVSKEADNTSKKTTTTLDVMRKRFSGLIPTIGFAAASAAIGALVTRATDFYDVMGKAGGRIGASAESFSTLAFAGKTADASMEQIEASLGRAARSISEFKSGTGEAADSLRALGFSARDFEGKDTAEAFALIAERVGRLPAGVDKTRHAIEIFGRSGAQLIPLMNDIAEKGFGAIRAEAEAFGALVTGETAAAAQAFNDDLARLQVAGGSLAREMIRRLIPALTEVGKATALAAKEGGFLHGAWVGLGGLFATVFSQTDAQKAERALEDTTNKIQVLEKQIENTRKNLEQGFIPGVKRELFGREVTLRPDIQIDDKRANKMRADMFELTAMLEAAKIKLKELQAQRDKPPAKPDDPLGLGLEGGFDPAQKVAELTKELGKGQAKAFETLNKQRSAFAEQQIANEERLAQARATTEAQGVSIAQQATQARQALARREFDLAIAQAQQKEQALADLAARTPGLQRGRSAAEVQAIIARQAFAEQLAAAQSYYQRLSQLQNEHVERYKASQEKIKSLDKELADSKLANETMLRDAQRAGWTEQERQAAQFRDLEKLRADFGSAVVRNAGAEARALKEQFDTIARGLIGVESYETAVGRLNGEVQSLFGALVNTEKAQQKAIGEQAAKGVKETNAELTKTEKLSKELASQELAAVKPKADEQGLRDLRRQIQESLLSAPFKIELQQPSGAPAPAFAGGGYVPGRSPHPRADDKLVAVTSGEFIHPVRAVKYYGPAFMEQIRTLKFPRFADGGLVGGSTPGAQDEVTLNLNVNGQGERRVRGPRDTVRSLVRDLDAVRRGLVK